MTQTTYKKLSLLYALLALPSSPLLCLTYSNLRYRKRKTDTFFPFKFNHVRR